MQFWTYKNITFKKYINKFDLIKLINIIKLMNLINNIINMNYTLKLFNTWQVTLPKKWRKQFDTNNFIAEENSEWLLIKPLINNNIKTCFYKNKEWFGIFNENWIDSELLIAKIKNLQNE